MVGEVKTGKNILGNGDDNGALVTKAMGLVEGQEDLRRGGWTLEVHANIVDHKSGALEARWHIGADDEDDNGVARRRMRRERD